MKAVAVFPGKPDSMHLADLPEPALGAVQDLRNDSRLVPEILKAFARSLLRAL